MSSTKNSNGNHVDTHNGHHHKNGHEQSDSVPLEGNTISVCQEGHQQKRYTYESLLETTKFIKERVNFTPKVGIICGSGLGSLADTLEASTTIPYEIIPHFPKSTVKGHVGSLVFGHLQGVPTVCMKGRFHYYEGYPLWKCCMPIRVMKLLGVTHIIITNAAGGLNSKFRVGDIMLVKDHINMMGFAGNNPLQGPNDERFGPRFPPMNKAYDRQMIKLGKQVAEDIGIGSKVHEGVYACLGGPNFETVAELRMLKIMGADAVGMSTVHEVITARHCNMDVFVFSLITNEGVVEYEHHQEPNHEEVIDAGKQREKDLKKFVAEILRRTFSTE